MPSMVDVGHKKPTQRKAIARATILFPLEVYQNLQLTKFQSAKGSIFQTAIIAGIMAAKSTSQLIPLCHPLPLDFIDIQINHCAPQKLIIDCLVELRAQTGVEMEALTGASIAALTVYDMCKAFSHEIIIQEIKLIEKSGGKNDIKTK